MRAPVLAISTFSIVLLVILAVLIIASVALYFWGKKLEKKSEQNKATLDSMQQTVSMLIIDKKRLRLKDAGLPKIVLEQTPFYLKRSKLPIVKAKVGPKITSFICEGDIYDQIPVKQEVKAVIAGLYIRSVKGKLLPKPAKRSFRQRLLAKLRK